MSCVYNSNCYSMSIAGEPTPLNNTFSYIVHLGDVSVDFPTPPRKTYSCIAIYCLCTTVLY